MTSGKCEQITCKEGELYDTLTKKCLDKYSNSMSLCPP